MKLVRNFRALALMTALLVPAVLAQQAKPGILSPDELKKVTPKDFFFRGQSAPVQLRNAAGIRAELAKCIEHARVVAAIGARLHEDEALDAELLCKAQIIRQRRKRRLVAQLRVAGGIALRRTEDVEMRVADQRGTADAVAWTDDHTGRPDSFRSASRIS